MSDFVDLTEESLAEQFSFNEITGPEYPLVLWLDPKRSRSAQVAGWIRRRCSIIEMINNQFAASTEILDDLLIHENKSVTPLYSSFVLLFVYETTSRINSTQSIFVHLCKKHYTDRNQFN